MTSTAGPPSDPNRPPGPSTPPPGYGAPPPGYNTPPPGYSTPPSGYGTPPQAGDPARPGPAGQDAAIDPTTGQPEQPRPAGFDSRGRVRRGRISATWVGLIAAAIVLILLIIFIAQNLDRPTIHFLGASGKFPLGLIVLLSAIAGVVIAAVPGTVRILQLRKALKKNTPMDQRRPDRGK
jgi:uncharacterized integral membrane protein